MELSGQHHRLELPESLRTQLFGFRRRVWLIKLAEVCCGALFGVLLGFLATFLLDRLFDTPAWIRLGILAGAMLACAMIPLALHHWVGSHRKLDQLARLLTRTHPGVGDQLLGVIELVRSDSEQARSLVLCRAAVDQVAEDARSRDFTHAVPNPRHRQRALLAGIMLITSAVMLALYPAAAVNAWSRFLAPWSDTPRYTFTMIDSLPDEIVVPHGEPFDVNISLAEGTASQPEQGTARLGIQRPVTAALDGNRYPFSLPAQIDTGWLDVRIGDFRKQVRIEPVLRPEPASFTAEVELPSYLQRDGKLTRDVRHPRGLMRPGRHAVARQGQPGAVPSEGQPRTVFGEHRRGAGRTPGSDDCQPSSPRRDGFESRVQLAGSARSGRSGAVHAQHRCPRRRSALDCLRRPAASQSRARYRTADLPHHRSG